MTSLVFVFLFGLTVPFIASRFGKFWACDFGTVLIRLWHKPHFPKGRTHHYRTILRQKWSKLWGYSVGWGLLMVFLCYTTFLFFSPTAYPWLVTLLCFLAILTAIDDRYYLLPDVFTIPLIILGFGYAIWGGMITPTESFIGAAYGFLLPSFCIFIVHPFLRDSFGAGDVKMLVALGVWFGMYELSFILLASVISFCLWAIIQRKRVNAYGPHLAVGTIIVLFANVFYPALFS